MYQKSTTSFNQNLKNRIDEPSFTPVQNNCYACYSTPSSKTAWEKKHFFVIDIFIYKQLFIICYIITSSILNCLLSLFLQKTFRLQLNFDILGAFFHLICLFFFKKIVRSFACSFLDLLFLSFIIVSCHF